MAITADVYSHVSDRLSKETIEEYEKYVSLSFQWNQEISHCQSGMPAPVLVPYVNKRSSQTRVYNIT
ncbi:hypothetical protein ABER98_11460 [Domibacillus aminovorans]|uniref:hypothetical protein n=1 Tax=Domibacillus aminovorans TaxID=29332 RepID=UPI003D245079